VNRSALPVDEILPRLLQTVHTSPNAILQADPGAGKTTRVPLALLDIIPETAGRIIMLEPRRLAAVSAARWMAGCLDEEVGRTVGYAIRFESRSGPATRIEVVTEGILTRRIQNDPLLEGVALVIFDEFHERSLQADLGLALCLDVQRQVRPDLKILVMSATLDTGPLSRLLGDAPVVSSPGRLFPVEELYLEDHQGPLPQRVATVVRRVAAETEGDLLVFLPGAGEIRACAAQLDDAMAERGIDVRPLYGDLPFEQQQAAIRAGGRRKVVLATSIAETSLTIDGVRVVVDCGLSRRVRHDQGNGMNRLVTVRESKASAEQRKGRAGRQGPGVCYRLFSRHTHHAMTPHTPPELLESDLAPLLLELAAWGVGEPGELPWLDPPPAAAIAVGRQLLRDLAAIDAAGRVTSLGRDMARLPLHPRLARLLIRSEEAGCPDLGCDLAALLSERDMIRRGVDSPRGGLCGRVSERLQLLREWRRTGRIPAVADAGSVKSVDRTAQLLRRLAGGKGDTAVEPGHDTVARLVLTAYPDRVGQWRGGEGERYLLANGSGVRLSSPTGATPAAMIVALSVAGGSAAEGVVHLAEDVHASTLRDELAECIVSRSQVVWEPRDGRISAFKGEFLGALCLASTPYVPRSEEQLPAIVGAIQTSGLSLLAPDDVFRQLQGRLLLLRRVFPDDGWPEADDAGLLDTLETWLTPFLAGVRTLQQLAGINLAGALLAQLEYRQRQAMDELAPTHLAVPSGSRIRLDYCGGDLPVLAVKLQELFGLAETPTVAGGRVAVLLHLLSPAGRPLQVTRDLKGFWDGSYQQVKKEMKGRYPKHPWPDDPWSAVPTRRAKPRGT